MDIEEMVVGTIILLAGIAGGFIWAYLDDKKRDRQ
jgi:hypothetical protein